MMVLVSCLQGQELVKRRGIKNIENLYRIATETF
jgi:hypothetical protein